MRKPLIELGLTREIPRRNIMEVKSQRLLNKEDKEKEDDL